MDVVAVRNGIVTNVLAVITTGLQALPYAPADGVPDLLYVARVLPVFDEAMGRGLDRVTATCRIVVAGTDEASAQAALDAYLAGSGARSLKAAIQSDKTLGGSCRSSRVVGFEGYGKAPLGSNEYWASELTIDIYGGN